ncbi:hypothetical protein L873DRAFT_1849519, partial [Choiromyces venosus 120613-1]
MNTILTRNIPLITSRLCMGKGFYKRFHATFKRTMDEDQCSGNASHITWERFSDHHTQYTNRFSAIEKDVSALGGMSEALVRLGGKVDKLEDKVDKLEGKIHTEFKTLGAKIEKHNGMMVVAWCMLLVPLAMVCGKIGYDWYEDQSRKIFFFFFTSRISSKSKKKKRKKKKKKGFY